MAITESQLTHWKEARQQLVGDLAPLESGVSKIGSNDGFGWVDITAESVARLRQAIHIYEQMIAEAEAALAHQIQEPEAIP